MWQSWISLVKILWEKILEGNNYDQGKDILETSDNGFILCGESNSNSGEFNYTTGQYDMWIVKLDDSGEILWKNRYGTSDGDYPLAVGETSEGYVMIGHSIGSYTLDPNAGSSTVWRHVVVTYAQGKLITYINGVKMLEGYFNFNTGTNLVSE